MPPDPRGLTAAAGPRLGVVVVRGRSMLPTLRDGDRLLAVWGARVRPGDVVVVRLPPADDGTLRPLSVKRATGREDGGWWVERDSPVEGVDSWIVGALADDDVLARVVCRLWPRPGGTRRATRE